MWFLVRPLRASEQRRTAPAVWSSLERDAAERRSRALASASSSERRTTADLRGAARLAETSTHSATRISSGSTRSLPSAGSGAPAAPASAAVPEPAAEARNPREAGLSRGTVADLHSKFAGLRIGRPRPALRAPHSHERGTQADRRRRPPSGRRAEPRWWRTGGARRRASRDALSSPHRYHKRGAVPACVRNQPATAEISALIFTIF